VNLYTIGFTKKSAEKFFTLLRESGATSVADIRLNNVSQLAGFAKRDDLAFFAREVAAMSYVHLPEFAPTQELLEAHRDGNLKWDAFSERFTDLMASRKVEETVDRRLLDNAVLLCSEHKPQDCHRSLVAEYLNAHWGGLTITHLV
jgi:uncharacterized protein (DUF488 family)